MAKEFSVLSRGFYFLQETESRNQFYFNRNKGEFLTDTDRELINFYRAYIRHNDNSTVSDKQPSFLKHLFHKIFG